VINQEARRDDYPSFELLLNPGTVGRQVEPTLLERESGRFRREGFVFDKPGHGKRPVQAATAC